MVDTNVTVDNSSKDKVVTDTIDKNENFNTTIYTNFPDKRGKKEISTIDLDMAKKATNYPREKNT